MIADIFNTLFGCNHKRTTFPLSKKSGSASRARSTNGYDTYVACLDCGKEFPYSWEEMRIVRNNRRALAAPEPVQSYSITK